MNEHIGHDKAFASKEFPEPEPVPNKNVYLKELEKSLNYSKKRRDNYEKFIKANRRKEIADYLPIRMDFENVSRCNFRCIMCQVSDWQKGKRASDMSFDDFKKLIDEQYGLVEIKIQGMGEPTMQGEDYFKMIRYARSRQIWVRTVTNGSLLHLKNNYKKLVDSGVNEIQISIDGADAQTFENIREGSNFEKVRSNCKLINDYCEEKNVERTKMWVVVQKSNSHQLDDLVDLGYNLGFKNIVFSLELVDWGQSDWKERNSKLSIGKTINTDRIYSLVEKGQKLGIKVRWWRQTQKYNSKSPEHLCPWPFERVYISSDMRVVACCVIGNPEVSDLGNALEFSKLWNGKTMKDFRSQHLSGNIPDYCKPCYINTTRNNK